jgi:signal transduction histidine kinase
MINGKMLLEWAGLAVSIFNTISLFWLGLTVLLNGNRRAPSTWLTGGGLLLGAIFFTSHSAILGRGLATSGLGMDFWWWVGWGPAIAAPLAWYGAMLWYAGFQLGKPHPHRPWLVGGMILAGTLIVLLIAGNPLPSYSHVVWRTLAPAPAIRGIPLLVLIYVFYSLYCYLLPLDVLRRAESTAQPLMAVARRRARPWLVAVSVLWLLAGIVMAWTALWALRAGPRATLADPAIVLAVAKFDLAVAGIIALAITLLGRTIVGYAVFTGRPLPRYGFFRQWRSTFILSAGLSTLIGGALAIHLRSLYSLIMVGMVMIIFHALYSWRFFAEREEFMAQLRPFVTSLDLYDQLISTTPPDTTAPKALFETLCRDVLGARTATLVPTGALATLTGPPQVYTADGSRIQIPPAAELVEGFAKEQRFLPAAKWGGNWAVALRTERGLGGVLLLGEKVNGNPYTEEEIEIAQAGGERLLDSLAGAEMARLAMDLLRQRIAQVKVLGAQGRRILHDEVLPQLHSAILYLGGLQDTPAVQQAVEALTAAHHQISDLMRDAPPTGPQHLAQQGLVESLRSLVEKEFVDGFDGIRWQIDPEAARMINRIPLFASEVVFFAAQELIRNAARHGRGKEKDRALHLTIRLEVNEDLYLAIQDDGVGYNPERISVTEGSGYGLGFHSTMLVAVGAGLEVMALPGGGTQGTITLPLGE